MSTTHRSNTWHVSEMSLTFGKKLIHFPEKYRAALYFIHYILTTRPISDSKRFLTFVRLLEKCVTMSNCYIWIHQIMEIYFNPSSLDQLTLLTEFILLFISIFSEFRLADLCSIKRKLLELNWFLPFIMYLLFSYYYPLRDATLLLLKTMIPFPYLDYDSHQLSNDDHWFVTTCY